MDKVTMDELVERTHVRLDDTGNPPRWSSESILRHLVEAEGEAAIRGSLLRDDSSAFTRITPGTSRTVLLDTRIHDVLGAYYADTGRNLEHTCEARLDRRQSGWRLQTSARPSSFFVTVLPVGRLRFELSRVPTDEEATIQLITVRKPLYPREGGDETELSAEDDEFLIEWAAYRCMSTRDPDLFDADGAAAALAKFEARFGIRETRLVERIQREGDTCQTVARRV